MGYDRFPETLIEEKKAIPNDMVARNGRVVFTHDRDIAVAYVERDDKGTCPARLPQGNVRKVAIAGGGWGAAGGRHYGPTRSRILRPANSASARESLPRTSR